MQGETVFLDSMRGIPSISRQDVVAILFGGASNAHFFVVALPMPN
jgi:hypothetical protein